MNDALIGHTGFVGSTLLRQRPFDALYRSATIAEIDGLSFDTVVCAGAPGKKWLANKEPDSDAAIIDGLIERLDTISASTVVLISTVDVFGDPSSVDESSPVDVQGLHAYGSNRRRLEQFVEQRFAQHTIVRLPGLVGPGLRKNVIFDLLHGNNLDAIDHRSVFQFYPMVNLWADIATALREAIPLVHLTAEPISVGAIAEHGFGQPFVNVVPGDPVRYDFRSRNASVFGGVAGYQYRSRESLLAIRSYAQSEPRLSAEER